jgi:3-oxoacyl-[acyl-carrier protein] reductase
MDLTGKTVLVTGASSGIGQAIAVACAKGRAAVLINYRKNHEGAKQTLKAVEQYSTGHIFQADLSDEKQISELFKEISQKSINIDALVNNAGEASPGNFFDNKLWKTQFENIFFSAVLVSQHFLKQQSKLKPRKIVNIGSVYGNLNTGNTEYFAYSAAKAALASMSVTLAKLDSNILVNCVAPGYTWTPPWEGISESDKRKCEDRTMIGRYTTADEIANFVVNVLENDSITGQVFTVDGGLSLQKLERK